MIFLPSEFSISKALFAYSNLDISKNVGCRKKNIGVQEENIGVQEEILFKSWVFFRNNGLGESISKRQRVEAVSVGIDGR